MNKEPLHDHEKKYGVENLGDENIEGFWIIEGDAVASWFDANRETYGQSSTEDKEFFLFEPENKHKDKFWDMSWNL